MRKWNVVALLLAFGFIASPIVSAQSNDDLRQEVEQLKRDLNKVMNQNQRILADNAELRATTEDSSLEERVNALADSLDYAAGTTVNSVANPVTLTGEFRVRTGYSHNRDFNNDDNSGTYEDARFRVGLTYDFSRDVTTHFEMQANGLYDNGFAPVGIGPLSLIYLYQGWIETRNLFGRKELSAKTGRQEIVLGNEFIFGDNDFFSGETFDGTHWMWSSDNFDLHVIFAKLNAENDFNGFNTINHPYSFNNDGFDDDELYSVYFTLKTIEHHTLDLFWVFFHGDGDGGFLPGSTGTVGNTITAQKVDYHTVGLSLRGMFEVAAGLDYAINFAYQFGDANIAGGGALAAGATDVQGMSVEAEIGLTFNKDNRFRIFLRFLWAEGPDNSDTGYIPLYMERHSNEGYRARYGLMDIIPVANVITLQGGLHFDPNADWTLGATVLWAQTDQDVLAGGSMESDIGWEIDLFAEYRYSNETTFSAGLGVFLPKDATPSFTGPGGYAGNDDEVSVLFYLQTRVVF
jgi:hypothetical protein